MGDSWDVVITLNVTLLRETNLRKFYEKTKNHGDADGSLRRPYIAI